jgi:hypothetical protein
MVTVFQKEGLSGIPLQNGSWELGLRWRLRCERFARGPPGIDLHTWRKRKETGSVKEEVEG